MVKFPMTFRGDAYRNSAIFEQDGRLRILLRIGWGSAGLAVQDLTDDLQPKDKPMPLWAEHPRAADAQEDPRVFFHHNRIHVAFVGVMNIKPMVTNVLYARLDEVGLRVEDTFAPHYQDRQGWEKNWEFFSHDGQLYAVYSIAPIHKVLKILDGERAEVAFETEWQTAWKKGAMRGGASPVLVGDEYWCWFHGVEDFPGRNPKRVYTGGVYTFSAKPPFEPRRCTPYPIMEASLEDRNGLDISVVYPCGAVLRDGQWLVSGGYHDREVRIWQFDHGLIERALR